MRNQRLSSSLLALLAALWVLLVAGTASAQQLTIAPGSFDFGSVLLGDPPPTTTFTASVNGTQTVIVTDITEDNGSGAACPDFAIEPVSYTFTGPATQDMTVTFTPVTRGAQSCTFTTMDNDTNDDSFTVTGTGVLPELTLGGVPTTCGSAKVGGTNTTTCTFTIENLDPANAPLNYTVASSDPQFTVNSTAGTVGIGNTQLVTITFDPTAAGLQTTTITITAVNGSTVPVRVFMVTGTGLQAILNPSPATLAIGSTPVGTAKTADETLTNTGNTPLTIDGANALTITGTNASEFSFFAPCNSSTSQTCDPNPALVIAGSGDARTVSVRCLPTSPGAKTATLNINGDQESGTGTVPMTCTGTSPDIEVSVPSLAFPSTKVGATAQLTFQVRNLATGTGASALTYTFAPPPSGFTISSPSCATPTTTGCSIAVGGAPHTWTVTFAPTGRGAVNGSLNVTTNDYDEPTKAVTLAGTGIAAEIGGASPGSRALAFADTDVGATSATLTAAITNVGDANLEISAVTLVGANPSDFAISSGATGAQAVSPSSTVQWQVRCNPTARGARGATLRIASDALGTANFDFTLTCVGLQAVFTASPASVAFPQTGVGTSSAPVVVTLTNANDVGARAGQVDSITSGNAAFTFSIVGGVLDTDIPPGGTLRVEAVFTPVNGTNFTGVTAVPLTFRTLTTAATVNLGTPVNVVVPMTGDGVTSGVDVAVAGIADLALDLGDLRVGVPETRRVTVTNTGDLAGVTLNAPTTAAPCVVLPVGFAAFPVTIAPGASRQFDLRVTPATAGTGACTVNVSTSLPSSDTINVSWNGVSPDVDLLAPVGGTLDFGAVELDAAPVTRLVQLENSGTAPLTIGGCSVTGASAGRYAVVPACGVQVVAPGATASFDVTYDPAVEALDPATLTFTVDAASTSAVVVTLAGIGVDRVLDLPALAYTFPDTYRNPGNGPVQNVVVGAALNTTTGAGAPVEVSMVVTSASVDGVFVLDGPTTATITAGESVEFPVRFVPPAAGTMYAGTLTVMNDSTDQPMAEIQLSGNGIARGVSVTPGTFDLGYTGVGVPLRLSELEQLITVANIDDADAYRVRELRLVDAGGLPVDGGPFSLLAPDAADLEPAQSTAYDVEFAPEVAGEFEVIVAVYLDEDPEPHALVLLRGTAVDIEVKGGGGCQVGGGGGGAGWGGLLLAVAGALALRRRRGVAAAALALAPATAQAQASRDLELSTFVPPPGTEIEGFTVESPAVGVDGAWSLSLAASHATNVLQVEAPSIGMTDRPITARTALQVGFAYAFLGQFEAGVRAPFYTQQGDEPMFSGLRPAGGATLGDVALHGKARLLGGPGGGPLALGASIDLTLPTAGDDRYAGVLGPSGHVRALASWGTRRFGANANLGFIGRRRVSLGDLRQGNALSYGAGAWFRALEKMWVVGEAFGSVGLGDAGPGLTQLEAVVGVRYEVTSSIGVSAGAGRGVLTGIGSPDLRGFLLVDVAPRAREPGPLVIVVPPPPRDERDDDGDTVVNADDGCPRDAEDADGFEDADGCPEADNDGDGVLDELDQCVAEPEDADGFKDDDGCPDDDNDGDGIPDAADKCPGEAEDFDGYLDGDGCDEPDNDGDGIPDLMDQCAIEAEVINGNNDDDGCPDSGDSLVMVMPDRIEIFEPVVFQGGGATLVKKSAGVLGQVAATMRANPDFKRVRVTVHVHPRDGGDQDLSERRAKAVRDWLVKWGVEPERVDARGMGSTRPLVPKTQKGAADLNDRVEFIILEKAVK